jgi:4-alpha-glucanotransferase
MKNRERYFRVWVGLFLFVGLSSWGTLVVATPPNASCGTRVAASAQTAPALDTSPIFKKRGAGVLLSVSSLAGDFASGDFGSAYGFVEWLHEAKQTWWQVLPLNPADISNSPFSSDSALALDVAYLDVVNLESLRLLKTSEIQSLKVSHSNRTVFSSARAIRAKALDLSFERFLQGANASLEKEFRQYQRKHRYWLKDHSSFMAIKGVHGYDFSKWPKALRDHRWAAVGAFRLKNLKAVRRIEFEQFLLDRQWAALKEYANTLGVRIIGDMPLYMTQFSANVWSHPEAFLLDSNRNPCLVSGYPPCDYYKNGQLWGTPVYDWKGLEASQYRFWVERVKRNLDLFDAVRIDHFLGLNQFYAIEGSAAHARDGEWKPAQGTKLLNRLVSVFGKSIPLIAEDLGASIPVEVHTMRKQFGIPGMYILQFGQGPNADPYHGLSEYSPEAIAYTGNHDMPTLNQWLQSTSDLDSLDEWDWIGRLLKSNANVVVVPAQDLLGLGADARMNEPGTWSTASEPHLRRDNWVWNLQPGALTPELAAKLAGMVEASNR